MKYKPDSDVTALVQHYSATPIEKDFTAKDIDRMHRKRGFSMIGYHYFIRKDGTLEFGRDMSKAGKFQMGAHCKGSNATSIGICVEGGVKAGAPNVGIDTRTQAQRATQIKLIRQLLKRFPNARVEGHRDMPKASTQCPGYDAAAWWAEVNAKPVEKPTPPKQSFWAALLALFTKGSST